MRRRDLLAIGAGAFLGVAGRGSGASETGDANRLSQSLTYLRHGAGGAFQIPGVGVIGDSYSGLNQLNPNRDDSRSWVEQLAREPVSDKVLKRRGTYDFGPFTPGSGFKNVMSAGTTAEIKSSGHLAEMGKLVNEKIVHYVVLGAGQLDLNNLTAYERIYSGAAAAAEIEKIKTDALANIDAAIDYLWGCGDIINPPFTILMTWGDLGFTPLGKEKFTDATKRLVVRSHIADMNRRLIAYAFQKARLPVVDLFKIAAQVERPPVMLGTQVLDPQKYQPAHADPTHCFADNLHFGTAMHGFIANTVAAAINYEFPWVGRLLTVQEIQENAGLPVDPGPPDFPPIRDFLILH